MDLAENKLINVAEQGEKEKSVNGHAPNLDVGITFAIERVGRSGATRR
jgi:hypothetical protein